MLAILPTPTQSVLEIGPLSVRYYALCIIAGIAIAIWLGDRRYRAKVSNGASVVSEVAITAVPAGIIGGRIYHVITSPSDYFSSSGQLINVFKIWEGGLGIWGAISLGLLAAFLRYRSLQKKHGFPSFTVFADAIAPGILFAQAIGRIGNWFNAELFGEPLDSWWALEIPFRYRPFGYTQFETFHPTFAYEALWCSLVAVLLLTLGKNLRNGQVFAAYVFAYCIGRFFIELIRIDEASTVAGLRINVWVSLVVGVLAAAYFLRASKKSV